MKLIFEFEEEWKPQAIDEVRLLANLNHINIIKLIDSHITHNEILMILQYATSKEYIILQTDELYIYIYI